MKIVAKRQQCADGCMCRNDAAIAKAEGLAKEHGVRAVAYKVDGEFCW